MNDPPFILRDDGSKRDGDVVAAGQWHLAIEDRPLTFIRVDHQVRLQLEDVEVVIEGRFDVRTGLGPLLALSPDTVALASVDSDGTLRLGLVSGGEIGIPPDPAYEAWQISGPGHTLVVCHPGSSGQLSVWS